MFETCNKCNLQKPIANKSKKLCKKCNFFRLHGKSEIEVQQEKLKNKVPKIKKDKPKQVTSQQVRERDAKSRLKVLKQQLHDEHQKNNTYYCQGCEVSGYEVHLDCSHIISVGSNKQFECVYDNIQLMCRECHRSHETNNPMKIFQHHCIDYNLMYFRKHAEYKFWKIYYKCIEFNLTNELKKMDEIDKNFLLQL